MNSQILEAVEEARVLTAMGMSLVAFGLLVVVYCIVVWMFYKKKGG